MKKRNVVVIFICSVILIALLDWYSSTSYYGSDDKAEIAISEVNINYKPWFEGLFKPTSAKTENILFGVQGALGVTFILFYLGKKKNAKNN